VHSVMLQEAEVKQDLRAVLAPRPWRWQHQAVRYDPAQEEARAYLEKFQPDMVQIIVTTPQRKVKETLGLAGYPAIGGSTYTKVNQMWRVLHPEEATP